MPPNVDEAILKALDLVASQTKMYASGGGSGFSSTYRITSTVDGQERNFFVKTGSGNDAEMMFTGEHASLNAISSAVPGFCPASHAHGPLSNKDMYFLATDFLHLHGGSGGGGKLSFAAQLGKLHTTPAPVPEGHERPVFGFPVTTCCGDTPQDNSWKESWAEFYADNRLRHVLRRGVDRNGPDEELHSLTERTASKVVPRLIGAVKEIMPVVVHGDLWSGNHSTGWIDSGGRAGEGKGAAGAVVYDPSAVYGHSEYELGIMNMFGGVGPAFWKEYLDMVPKAEPVEEWEDRIELYELYHHLNHYAIFGGGYRGGAMSIMRRLISKYG